MFEKIDECGKISKTSAINVATCYETFSKFAKDQDVVFIGIGTGFSSGTSAAMMAAKEFDNVYVVDSKNLSTGLGILVNKAVKFRSEGFSAKEIASKVEALTLFVRTQFVINTLKYLHMGGRCSGVVRILGTALNIKPIIRVVDNKMVVAKKPIGYKRGLEALLQYLEHDKDVLDQDMMTVTHCLADEDAKYLKKEVANRLGYKNLVETYAGCVISTHCGPRSIGFAYLITENK